MIPTSEVAARLGVKRATVYAYVSRGLLTSIKQPGQQESLFDPVEVQTLARRQDRPEQLRAMRFQSIMSSVSEQQDSGLWFRGVNALHLAGEVTVEEAAALVLGLDTVPEIQTTTVVPDSGLAEVSGPTAGVDVMLNVLSGHAAEHSLANPRIGNGPGPDCGIGAGAGSLDPIPGAVFDFLGQCASALAGRSVVPAVDRADSGGVAGAVLCAGGNVSPAVWQVELMNSMLILMLDNGLTASTVTARVAASVRAPWARCLAAGLHSSLGVGHALAAWEAYADLLGDNGNRERGLDRACGHPVYSGGDPRASYLVAKVRQVASDDDQVARLLELFDSRSREPVNVDAALVLVGVACGLRPEVLAVMFMLPRLAGMGAHVMEEYAESPGRWRARATPQD